MAVRKTRKQRIKRKQQRRKTRHVKRHRGGNYESDVTIAQYEGEPMKAPNTITVAHNGQIMSVTSLLNKLNDFILHGPDY